MDKIPVIIDCDTGTDDAWAIVLANSSDKLDIRALTAVNGNVELKHTGPNNLNLREYLNIDCRVALGADRPVSGGVNPIPDVHGENGLGGVELPKAKRDFDEKYAWDVIAEEAERAAGELVILAVGPLTNIAITFLKHPEAKKNIKRIVMMGGAFGTGNTNPYAEFNIWIDPHACDIVFKSGVPITMVGLDATRMTTLTGQEQEALLAQPTKIDLLLRGMRKYFIESHKAMGRPDAVTLHDALAVAAVIDPTVLHTEKYYVVCETKSSQSVGQTVVDFKGHLHREPNVDVAMSADKEKFVQMLRACIACYAQ
ncbi:Pyrimidine-specific ribonucleoside hydrolase rihA [Anaerotruncus sp. 2789STDY5834896]|uniref:Pyrimidine-specific ribonucleoside hydrolase rihA n=1 Tax=uncultured Anaerotruncus sp. TaxID=905011 RepID=A0A1C6JXQ3_9FIRM|nr:Pyrimidine-specific ribonucleoside hydrolase rihA [uncultured Anaerotruncus sp.]